ncbi:MAG: iron-sulfur cluster assembly scaffold protein [Candidatus Falkowbacteria bacterium]
MLYTEKVMEHFKNPHNQGSIPDADAVGQEGNPVCGDVMKVYLKIKNDVIEDIKFETLGCAAAIAVSSAMTDMAKGKTLDEVMKMTKDDIVNDLGGLPVQKVHCSMLGVDALKQAIKKYREGGERPEAGKK